MTESTRRRSSRLLLFFSSISLQFVSGFSDDPSDSKTDSKTKNHANSNGSTGTRVVMIFLGVATVVLFSLFLYKLWQKKKREEQYNRLLKLFEEDDELEVELGIRD